LLVAVLVGVPTRFEPVPTINSIIPSAGRGVQPELLVVSLIDLRAEVIPIAVDTRGVLTPPADTAKVGWWNRSAGAGAERGQILLTGHTVHTGGGVMNRMGEVVPGTKIELISHGKHYKYRAVKNEVLSKQKLAAQARDLFGQSRHAGRLVLVTCTDFDGTEYLSNIVVFAEPA
jgi:hypothetical protein